MSADIYVQPRACDHCGQEPESLDFNFTYNLSPMLWGAGMPAWSEFVGMRAEDAGLIWEAVVDELSAHPDRYRALNPSNGWGSYDGAVNTLTALAEACANHPDAVIEAWL